MESGDRANTSRKLSEKKQKPPNQKEQSERFKQAARELDVDESGKAFERALESITRQK